MRIFTPRRITIYTAWSILFLSLHVLRSYVQLTQKDDHETGRVIKTEIQHRWNSTMKACSEMRCTKDCRVEIAIDGGGDFPISDNVLIITIITSSCNISTSREFDLQKSSRDFTAYMDSLTVGTIVTGIIGPEATEIMPDVFSTLSKLGIKLDPLNPPQHKIITFVAMVRFHEYARYKEFAVRNPGSVFWSVDVYTGQPIEVNLEDLSMEQLERKFPRVIPGLGWAPMSCQPRSRVALIVPFRDREAHLHTFLNNIIPVLQAQHLAFHIFIIDQSIPELFNRALLMNIGYLEAKKTSSFSHYVFHDVDLLPEDLCNAYTCSEQSPRHLSVAVSTLNYRLPYQGIFGGATILTQQHIERINGFPTIFFGWGGEDDNINTRLVNAGLLKERYPTYIGRYHMIQHGTDKLNGRSGRSMEQVIELAKYYAFDGLNTTHYTREAVTHDKLFTRIKVKIKGPRTFFDARKLVEQKEKEFQEKLGH